ncbi:hypothetical protein D3C86_2181200 [compost metagenome]
MLGGGASSSHLTDMVMSAPLLYMIFSPAFLLIVLAALALNSPVAKVTLKNTIIA